MITATLNRAPISHRKIELAAALVRGMKAEDAVIQLKFQKQKSCHILSKVVRSCVANAENNANIDPDTLVIDRIEIGRDTGLRRFHARGRGRSARVTKHYSNIKVILKSNI